MLALRTLQRSSRLLATRAASTTPVALVGCGMPGRGMGWYHAKQILDGDVPSATLTDIVEPWFLGGGADGPGGAEFAAFKAEHEGKVRFHASIADMPKPDGNMMAMVCTRTADMPGYVDELVDHGVSHVFLEKPGAPTVDELGRMKDDCAAKGATIWMGFNKNVTAYVTKGREALAKVPGGDFTLVHHNAYKANELGECFERNAEGMLKNMAIHELALLVTFFGVNSDTLSDVVADKNYSDLRTEKGPSSGDDFTDFSRIGFTVTTKAGAKVSVYADRCGLELPDGAMADGGMMYSSVSKLGIIQSRDIMPDADLVATVEARSKENPDWMPYFHLQHDDYITLKERCTAHIASGAAGDPEGIATIQVGYDTLKLAETLKPLLEKQLL
jgi:predicted dehydrogenase